MSFRKADLEIVAQQNENKDDYYLDGVCENLPIICSKFVKRFFKEFHLPTRISIKLYKKFGAKGSKLIYIMRHNSCRYFVNRFSWSDRKHLDTISDVDDCNNHYIFRKSREFLAGMDFPVGKVVPVYILITAIRD